MKSYLYLLALLTLIISCSQDQALDPEDIVEEFQLKGSITGSIIDTQGNPISGVAATLDSAGYDTQSDPNGQYTIPDVPRGAYSITFTHAFHEDTTINNIAILEDQDLIITNVVMRAKPIADSLLNGFVKGIIFETNNEINFAGATISIDGQSATSQNDGSFLMSKISEGKHEVLITGPSCETPQLDSIEVTLGDTTDLELIQISCSFNLNELGFIQGKVVTTGDLTPISGISASTDSGLTATSGSDGEFLISLVKTGQRKVSLTAANYQNVNDINVTVTAGDTIDIGVYELTPTELTPTGTIKGTVDADIPGGVTIEAQKTGNGIEEDVRATTDAQGNFIMPGVKIGQYRLTAINNYTSESMSITVIEDDTIIVNLINVVPNNNTQAMSVFGTLTDGSNYGETVSSRNSIDSITVEIYSEDSSYSNTYGSSWDINTGTFSSITYIPREDDRTFHAIVKGYELNKVVFYAKQNFNRLTSNVNIISDDVWNAKPKIWWDSNNPLPNKVSINDDLFLYPTVELGEDDLNESEITYQYRLEGESTWKPMVQGHKVQASSTPDPQFDLYIKIIDTQGNEIIRRYDVEVVEDAPTVSFVNPYILGRNKEKEFSMAASDIYTQFNNFEFEWSKDGINYFSGNASESFSWSTTGKKWLYGKVIDDDGIEVIDSIPVVVNESFTDIRDLEVYTYTQIGTQTWMTENLRFDPGGAWDTICEENDSDCIKRGRYYQPATLLQVDNIFSYKSPGSPVQGVCPTGWHLPSKQELDTLINYVETNHSNTSSAISLRAMDGSWGEYLVDGDPYNFALIPTGYTNGSTHWHRNQSAYLWSSTKRSESGDQLQFVNSEYNKDLMEESYVSYAYIPVRCIMN